MGFNPRAREGRDGVVGFEPYDQWFQSTRP